MNSEHPPLSTFDKSCRHWSEQGQAGMDAFYRLATIDYRLLAEQLEWGRVFSELRERFGSPVRLLDVACGSGQFPRALREHGGLEGCHELHVEYSLLDPSEFSIRTARQHLTGPFEAAEEFLCTAQQLEPPEARYPLLWATHALYCVPRREVGLAVDRILAALDPAGLGFIAHASQNSHYLRFQDLYLQHFQSGAAEPYCSGEQVIEALREKVPATALSCWSIEYEGRLPLDDRETAEGYLQRCLFDDAVRLENMLSHPQMGDYLRVCMDRSTESWRFPQKVWLIFFGELAGLTRDWRRA